jgi:hypothetical protein
VEVFSCAHFPRLAPARRDVLRNSSPFLNVAPRRVALVRGFSHDASSIMIDSLDLYVALVIASIAGYALIVLKSPSINRQASGDIKVEIESSLPTWDVEWEHQDPLRGRAGWEIRDYVNIFVASGLLLTTIGLLIPLIHVAREAESRVVSINKYRETEFRMYSRPHPFDPQFP